MLLSTLPVLTLNSNIVNLQQVFDPFLRGKGWRQRVLNIRQGLEKEKGSRLAFRC